MKAQHSLHGEALHSPYFSNLTIETPVYLRLPKAGKRCAATGLSRSTLNELILPTPSNDYRPPVRSIVLRKRGASRGCRLVSFESLTAYLASLADEANADVQHRQMAQETIRAQKVEEETP